MSTRGEMWFEETIFFQSNSITVRKLKQQIIRRMKLPD